MQMIERSKTWHQWDSFLSFLKPRVDMIWPVGAMLDAAHYQSTKTELWKQKGWILALKPITVSRSNLSWNLSQQEAHSQMNFFPFEFLFHVYLFIYCIMHFTSHLTVQQYHCHGEMIGMIGEMIGKKLFHAELQYFADFISTIYLHVSRPIINSLFQRYIYSQAYLQKTRLDQSFSSKENELNGVQWDHLWRSYCSQLVDFPHTTYLAILLAYCTGKLEEEKKSLKINK